MNKHSKKIVKTAGILVLFLLGVVFFRGCLKTYIFIEKDPNLKYEIYDQDKYIHFNDGRFQIWRWPTDMSQLQLIDFISDVSGHFYVIREIKKYILIDNILYVSGDFSPGSTDLKTGDRITYSSISEIPQLMILNIDNGDAVYYLSLEELSEADKAYFEMDLTGLKCLKDRTCYEKGADTEPSWSEVFIRIIENAFSW